MKNMESFHASIHPSNSLTIYSSVSHRTDPMVALSEAVIETAGVETHDFERQALFQTVTSKLIALEPLEEPADSEASATPKFGQLAVTYDVQVGRQRTPRRLWFPKESLIHTNTGRVAAMEVRLLAGLSGGTILQSLNAVRWDRGMKPADSEKTLARVHTHLWRIAYAAA